MTKIAIEKGIPLPGKGYSKYPLADLEVGDSFFAPGLRSDTFSGRFSSQKPRKFTCRTTEENGVAGVRVWRIL